MESAQISYNNITLPYGDAVDQYPRLATMQSNAVHELESKYGYPAFKHTNQMQATLVFDDNSEGEPVGFTLWFYDANERMFFIGLVYVEPKYRRRGYAEKMYDIITEIAKNVYEAKWLYAAVINKNVASIELHKQFFGYPAAGSIFIKRLAD